MRGRAHRARGMMNETCAHIQTCMGGKSKYWWKMCVSNNHNARPGGRIFNGEQAWRILLSSCRMADICSLCCLFEILKQNRRHQALHLSLLLPHARRIPIQHASYARTRACCARAYSNGGVAYLLRSKHINAVVANLCLFSDKRHSNERRKQKANGMRSHIISQYSPGSNKI